MEKNGAAPDKEELTAPLLVSVEDMIEQNIGSINYTQILQTVLASVPTFYDSQQTFITIFTHGEPSWHCTNNNTSCNSSSNICSLPKSEWAWDSGNVHTSIISEWNLSCAGSFISSFPATIYFVGCLLGGLAVATLGDSKLGRKNLLCLSTLFMSLAALGAAMAPNVWVYSMFRFLCGAGRASLSVCVLVLLTERVSKRWRGLAASIAFMSFSVGLLGLTGVAYLTKDYSWRILHMCVSISGIIWSIVCYKFLYESPRWLYMQGRAKDAMDVLSSLSSTSQISQIMPNICTVGKASTATSTNAFASLNILFSRRWAVKRLSAAMFLACGIGLNYFGVFLAVENLGYNIYLTSVFNSLISFISYTITLLFWFQRFDRRTSLLGFCTVGGATCIVISVIGRGNGVVIMGLELVSLFCACIACCLVLMYNVELFPTCVRNSAASLARQAMILGSVFDPMLILLGKENLIYSYGVFGIAMLVCGFVVLCLPETRGKVMCDTMEEQEFRDYGSKLVL